MREPTLRVFDAIAKANPYSDEIERIVRDGVSDDDRSDLGQVFTPWPIAELMATWLTASGAKRILDPACGPSIFARALSSLSDKPLHITLGDLDESSLEVAHFATEPLDNLETTIVPGDYLTSDFHHYDGIIANPPYVKHHRVPFKDLYQELLLDKTGIKFPASSNLYCWFYQKALTQLAPGGRMAFITPSEFLNANYGVAHKKALLDSGTWKYLILFDFTDEVFEDALTTGCITLFENGDEPSQELTIIQAHSGDLDAVKALISGDESVLPQLQVKVIANKDLDPERKWARYIRDTDTSAHAHLVPFTDYAVAKRGIATGHNDFFTFSKDKQKQWGLPDEFFVPCLTKASHAVKLLLEEKDMQAMSDSGQKVSLLYLKGDEQDPSLDAYIEHGIEQGVDQRYITKNRTPWWKMETKDEPDIFATVFGRDGLRFVRNIAGARSLACCHGIYVKDAANTNLMMAWLLTDFAQECVLEERREYGAGLQKVEPGDINKSLVVNLSELTDEERVGIIAVYEQWVVAEQDGDDDGALAARADLDARFRASVVQS